MQTSAILAYASILVWTIGHAPRAAESDFVSVETFRGSAVLTGRAVSASSEDPLNDGSLIDGPQIDGPQIDGPQIDGPQIDGPQIDGLQIDGPQIDAPQIDELQIDGPQIDAPQIHELKIDEPQIDRPQIDGPQIDAPQIHEPHIDELKIDEPQIDRPQIDGPQIDASPVADSPVTDPPVTDPPVTDPLVSDPSVTDPPATESTPEPPTRTTVRVRFSLVDGVEIKGELREWDDQGIDGSFGRRRWSDIRYKDIWKLYRKVHEEMAAPDWVELGRILLLASLDQTGAVDWSERAFGRARRPYKGDPKDAETHEQRIERAIDSARDEVADVKRMREEAEAIARAERLTTVSPEAMAWRPDPWKKLTADEQEDAVRTMREDATRILDAAGLTIAPVETDYFLFYSDLPRDESAKWASELDLMYKRLAKRFNLAEDENIFWGKAVIFVFRQRDRYRLIEAEAFGHLVPEWADGLCHPIGEKVFVNFHRPPKTNRFAAVLVHETSHGFMHRYRTPRRLPTWANEGFSDYLASVLFRNSPIDQQRRHPGVRYVRRGSDVNAVLDWDYTNGQWPGPGHVGYSIGYLMVELMIRDRPKAFGQWVDAIKDGKDWELALVEDFGVPREKLVETFVRYYKVND